MEITVQPKKNHSGFNPIIFKVSDATATEYTINIYVPFLNKTINVYGEFFNGVATYDLSGIVRSIFLDEMVKINTSPEIYTNNFYSFRYAVQFPAYNDFEQITNYYYAYRSVNQIGKHFTDYTAIFFGTEQNKIKVYEGFPTKIACVHGGKDAYINVGSNQYHDFGVHCFVSVPTNVNSIQMLSYFSNTITTEDLEEITSEGLVLISTDKSGNTEYGIELPVILDCVPENPFYIRWDNKKTGWDYWMFKDAKFFSRKSTNNVVFKNYYENSSIARKDKQKINTELNETITVGEYGLDDIDYKVLSEIIDSNNVVYYDTEINDWISLIITEHNIDNDKNNPSKNIELTFELPTPQKIF